MTTLLTQERLTTDLRNLGVASGDILFIHSSFKSLGPVAGGAATVVAALEDAVGPAGLILMPSFNLVERSQRAATWNHATTPSTVGWLTEFLRTMPGTYRSDHYSHAVAARGQGAQAFVADHLRQEGYRSPWDLAPWGKTYGVHSPMVRAYQANGKLLMLGVDYTTSTYVHFVEVIVWNRQLEQHPAAPYPALNRPALGKFWDQQGYLQQRAVGMAACRLFSILRYVDTLVEEVEKNLGLYLIHARGRSDSRATSP